MIHYLSIILSITALIINIIAFIRVMGMKKLINDSNKSFLGRIGKLERYKSDWQEGFEYKYKPLFERILIDFGYGYGLEDRKNIFGGTFQKPVCYNKKWDALLDHLNIEWREKDVEEGFFKKKKAKSK